MNIFIENILNLNLYLFNNKKFLNKILFEKISLLKLKTDIEILNYYNNLKKSLCFFNPFYGVKLNTYFEKIKLNFFYKKKINNKINIYRNFLNYKIPYKDLTYIFNLSIEKLRIKKKNV